MKIGTKTDLMEKFLEDRKKLTSYSRLQYVNRPERPYLFIDQPELLAAFAGYLKHQCRKHRKTKVFCRGQVNDHPGIPNLFRGSDLTNDRLQKRLHAYKALLDGTKNLYGATARFQKNIGPIFQHYGLKTPWLDLVDNIFVALWFATQQCLIGQCRTQPRYEPSREEFGHIYFYETTTETKYFDLREKHSSLSLRLHVQHGVSITLKEPNWTLETRELKDQLVATVKFPNEKKWRPKGQLFSETFFFPGPEIDNTYKYLKKTKFQELLRAIEQANQLDQHELGAVW